MLNDPAYLQACNDAVYSVFTDTQLDYSPTPEREAYISRYAGTRPLTLALLEQAWRSCQANEQRHQRGELLDQYQRPQDAQPPSLKERSTPSRMRPWTIYTIEVFGLWWPQSAVPECWRRWLCLVPYAASNSGIPRTGWRVTSGTITQKVRSAWRTARSPSCTAIPLPSAARGALWQCALSGWRRR
jgi:hypothetical protein